MTAASFRNYTFKYALGESNALAGVNLEIQKGEFLVICGASGSGKSTLLLSMKKEIAPTGETGGELDVFVPPHEIAVVFQNCDTQLVTSSVINDLAFHMENIGLNNTTMKKRMAETVGYFGLEGILHKSPSDLSGGQKQLAALCAAMMTLPKLLLLDEPISRLDPISANGFLDTLRRINEDLGVTVVIAEHRADSIINMAHRVILMDSGRIAYCGKPADVAADIWHKEDERNTYFLPVLTKSSLTISDGKTAVFTPSQFIREFGKAKKEMPLPSTEKTNGGIAVRADRLSYKYPGSADYVLKNLDISIEKGKLTCLTGGNGSGKSTLLKVLAGVIRPYMGGLKRSCTKIGYMPQSLNAFFTADTVADELSECDDSAFCSEIINSLGLEQLLCRHPYDISGGEQQRAALAAILLKKPDLILLDEPTKGLDRYYKTVAASLLKKSGAAVVASTHDLEFAAFYADLCMMLFDGDIAFSGTPHEFFRQNRYYTTEVSKAVGLGAIKYEDVIYLWEKEKPEFTSEY